MRRILLLAAVVLLGGCASAAYYAQSIRGQIGVMAASRPIDAVLDDPRTPGRVRRILTRVPAMRRFAVAELGLAASDSYTLYADVRREAMVWSVIAAPADSLRPREWCFPVAGCTSYRGYFDRRAARDYAARLAADGWDVAVQAVPAYSTLGWFSDPLPSTVVDWPLADIAGLVFHELAHETLYVPDDTAFNEGYATVVENEGVRRWLRLHGGPRERARRVEKERRRAEIRQLLDAARARLAALYASPPARAALLARKRAVFAKLRADYATLTQTWDGDAEYDRWFDRPLNNAHLAAADIYHAREPALRRLLQALDGDMEAFQAACRRIAAMDEPRRHAVLDALEQGAESGVLALLR